MKLEKSDPIKILADYHCRESFLKGDKDKTIEMIMKFIDMAYYRGLEDASKKISTLNFDLMSQKRWIDIIEDVKDNAK